MVDPSHSFYIADYIVFGATIAISIGIGIFYALSGDRQRTTSEYLVGGRAMKFVPVAISLMVSFESSIMMLGLPAETYTYGIQWWIGCLGFMFSQIVAIVVMVPLIHPLRITSAYEYLLLRYNSTAVRLLGSFLGIWSNVWYMGIVLFGPAIALEAVTGFPQWGSIFVVAFVAVIYTSIGGIKAVIWTDVFQALVMYAGLMSVLIKGTLDAGGPASVWYAAQDGGRMNFFNFDVDPRTRHTFWNLMFGSFFRGFGLIFNQSTIQRISSTKTQREAKWVMLIMAPCFAVSLSMACYEGIVAYAYYQTKGCDPLESNKIADPNQIIPFTVMDIFQRLPGMPGLFLASLFSASLSTLSSGLSSVSALLWTDFLKPKMGNISELKATIIAKISVVVFGVMACGVALLVSLIGGPLTQIAGSLLAAFGAPLTGLFLLGCFFPFANAKGALLGGLISMVITAWLAMGKSFAKNIPRAPTLPSASIDRCLANHSDLLMSMTTPLGLSGVEVAMAEQTAVSYVWGGDNTYDTTGYYESSSAMDTTTAADAGVQGIEVIYTLSYQWLAPVGILLTISVGSIISLCTGGNKKGEVDPRYLLSFCDHLCFFLPESIRKLFRCGEDYASVQNANKPPIHDLCQDKVIIIPEPTDEGRQETRPMIHMTEVDEHKTGNDVNNVVAHPELNGDSRTPQSFDKGNGDVGAKQ